MTAEPRAEIHVHLEGTASPLLAREMAARHGVDISGLVRGQTYGWQGFGGFLAAYDLIAALFRSEEDYRRLALDYLTRLSSDGALYCEIFISPDHAREAGLSPEAYLSGIESGVAEAQERTGIACRLIVVGVRHLGPAAVEGAARFAARSGHGLVTGFGLAGDERAHRPRDFARAFDMAREAGLGLTAHAGEFAGASAVAETLDALKVSRLGHGVRAIEDPALVRRLAQEGVTLEVCPGSNLSLGVYPSLEAHPLRALHEAGVRLTVNSDDPPFFGTDLAREYALARKAGFTAPERLALTRNAIEAAFVDEETRRRLLERLMLRAISLGAPGTSD
ncbi:adenosine deaminase [Aureimonas populi]|uniref:Adenine deaminase n=1 Tax=Aureimonas populi TaxID=1701758 RepID=A0ABW5CMB9_9HYPH|nr:adenosine deaminase [Aureimonas populi]